jgi:hypothetical protein
MLLLLRAKSCRQMIILHMRTNINNPAAVAHMLALHPALLHRQSYACTCIYSCFTRRTATLSEFGCRGGVRHVRGAVR